MISDVKTIVSLLMKRPITEEIVMQVAQIPGYEHLEITDGNWVLDKEDDEMTTGEEHGWIEAIVSFVKQSNITPSQGFIYGAPDLAVEIVSPSQKEPQMLAKANEYFHYGTQVVWLVYPRQKTIEVHTPGKAIKYGLGDTIPGGDLLPGFSLSVSQVFES